MRIADDFDAIAARMRELNAPDAVVALRSINDILSQRSFASREMATPPGWLASFEELHCPSDALLETVRAVLADLRGHSPSVGGRSTAPTVGAREGGANLSPATAHTSDIANTSAVNLPQVEGVFFRVCGIPRARNFSPREKKVERV